MTEERAVKIDNRLSDLFQTRRQEAEAGTLVPEVSESIAVDYATSWLDQFKAAAVEDSVEAQHESISVVTTFRVKKSECRPFWAPSDTKQTNAIWKKSKLVLAKDCLKQRKAALRKTAKR